MDDDSVWRALAWLPHALHSTINFIGPVLTGPGLLIILAVIGMYFFPTLVACLRRHPQSVAILVLNFFLGWTFLGWVLSLVWACTSVPDKTYDAYFQKVYREYMDAHSSDTPVSREGETEGFPRVWHWGRVRPSARS